MVYQLGSRCRSWCRSSRCCCLQIATTVHACKLKLGDIKGAVLETDFAMRDREDNVKALFRQGQICNAVAVVLLLNATLILPKFLYSNVWKDPSQFGDIYQEDFFMNTLKNEVSIEKELPPHLRLLDIEAIGSLITDADITKEAMPIEYIEKVLPLLLQNGVVHFLGFGNRLGFDPLPFQLQRLRCKCNFVALKFVPNIQRVGSLLIKRIRKYDASFYQPLSQFDHEGRSPYTR